METISPTALSKLEARLLSKQLRYVTKASRFYKDKFGRERVDGGSISDLRRFKRLPLTTKDELRASQERSPPFGDYLAVPLEMVNRIHRTSGTTGRPLFMGLTRNDIALINECGARAFWSAGLRPGMKVVHCMNYSLWLGGYTDHSSLEALGAAVVPFGVGQSKVLLRTIEALRVDAISATTSYPALLAKIAEEELHLRPDSLGLKLALLGGEVGMGVPSFRRSIERAWGMKAFDANFGLADVLSNFGAECRYRDGLHFLGQGGVLLELMDPNSGEMVELDDGEEGELILTNLAKESQPLVRYRTGDIIRVLTTDRCECGRTGFRFSVMGRTHDVLKVKGINIYVSAIQDLIASFAPETNGEFQIVLATPPPISRLQVRFEVATSSEKSPGKLVERMRLAMKETLGIEADFEAMPANSLPRFEGKTQRIVREYEQGSKD